MKTILCIAIILALSSAYYIKQGKCCEANQYWDAAQKKCAACSDKCNGCAESNEAHDNGEDTGCICKGTLCKAGQCDKTGCKTCVDAKAGQKIFKANGECFECTDKANCVSCTAGKDDCDKCAAGYALVSKKCEKCSDNCKVCNSSAACTVCNDNFMLSAAICVQCITNCNVCTATTEQCTTCADNYGFWNKVCNQCSSVKAKTCATAANKHTVCQAEGGLGSYLDTADDTCKACIANCAECTLATKTECAAGKCKAGWQRANSTTCTACTTAKNVTNHAFADGNQKACATCKDGDSGLCTSCDTTADAGAKNFSYRDSDNTCHPACDVLNGTTNDGKQTCKTCTVMAPKYGSTGAANHVEFSTYNVVLISGHCVKCTLGCKTCTSAAAAKCTELLPGWGKGGANTTEFTPQKCLTAPNGGTDTATKLIGCIDCTQVASDANDYNGCKACAAGAVTVTIAAGQTGICLGCHSTAKTFSWCGADCASAQNDAQMTCKTKCKVGSYPHAATFPNAGQRCYPCTSTDCTACSATATAGEGQCDNCPAGKGDNKTNGNKNATCTNCVDTNCKLCQANHATCTECDPTYHTPGTSACTACTASYNCATCSKANECDTCASSRILDATTKKCELCATGCTGGACTTKGACNAGKCAANYMETKSITCTACISNCKVCSEANKCDTCITGWTKVGDTCSQCDKNCSTCSAAGKCSSGGCNAGYRLNTDVCEKCDDASCKLCAADKATCTECLATSGKGIKAGKCENCVANCKSCVSDNATCATCNDGYFGNGTAKCEKCPVGCNKCTSLTACGAANCKTGYYGEKCIKCAADCSACTEADKCNKDGCKTGFVYIESSKTCASKATCEKNQFYDAAKNTCTNCGTNCLTCTSATECTKCAVGHYPESGKNSCKECATKSEGLDNCTSTGAVASCIDGYGKIGTACGKCIANCADCTAATTCSKCMPGYNFTQDFKSCGECAEGCAHCYSECARGCEKCFDTKKQPPNCACAAGTTWNKTTKKCDAAAAKTTAATTTPATTAAASANILKFAAIVLISLISLL